MRLIDADALMKRIAHHTVHDSLKRITFEAANTYEQVKGDMFNLVQKAPTIDAEPIVRCKDCHWAYYEFGDVHCCTLHKGMPLITPISFCSYGIRRLSNAID